MKGEKSLFTNINQALLPDFSGSLWLLGMIILLIQIFSIPAFAQKVEYNNGYDLIYYDDGSKEIINGAMNFLRWDGVWRPNSELNISNGSWPYLYSENATNASFKVNDTTLSIPKSNTKFKTRLNSISYDLIYSKSELLGKEKYINLTSAFIDFPYSFKSKKQKNEYKEDEFNIRYDRFHFKAGIEHIVIHDDTPRDYIEDGKVFQDVTYLNKKDYDFRIKNGQIRLVFKKDALNKLNGNIIIEIRTWDVVSANNSLWGGNVTFNSTSEVRSTGNVELKQKVDDYALYTRFDEGSGRTIHNENTGTIPEGNLEGDLGSGTYTNGKYGKAIYFNGINNKVLFNDNAAFRLPYDFTIAYYLKLASGVDNLDTDIIRKGSTATANETGSWYKIELTNNLIHGSVTKNWNAPAESNDTQERRDNLWHFVAYERQSTTCSLVVDGITVRTTQNCPTEAVNTASLSIGSKDTYDSTSGLDFTNGTIDEVRVYNRGLNMSELASIRNNTHYPSGTVTRNLTSSIGTGEEIKELGCNGTWDRSITKVDVLASTNNINWDMIQSNTYPDVVYSINPGNNYRYSRCALSTTDSSKTPVIESIRTKIGPKLSYLVAEAGGPYIESPGVSINFTGFASGGTPPYTYNWTFGDGGISSQQNPVHTYTFAGFYIANLTVTDINGNSSNDSASVTISPESMSISNIVAASGRNYAKDTLAPGKLFYIDRTYTFSSVPSAYIGLDYIKTATNDRYNTSTDFLQFDVNTDATVYIAYDDRISPKPSWLSSFTDTGNNLARSDGIVFSIYSKSFPAGHISLGGCSISSTGAGGMYIVIVKQAGTPVYSPLGVTITKSPDPVMSNNTSHVTVHVTSNGSPVEGATIFASVNGGSLVSSVGLTDINGEFKTDYNAPDVTTSMVFTMSAIASKTGFIAGSDSDQITVNPIQTPVLNYIILSPSSTTTLTVGQTQKFNATAKDQNGNPMSGINISWTSSNLTVGNLTPLFSITGSDGNAQATFNALVSGKTNVKAQNGSVNNSTPVTVNPIQTPVLNYIILSPSTTTTLTVGQTQKFNATAKDQNGNPMSGINISWTSSNLTVGNLTPLFSITGSDGNAQATFNALVSGKANVKAQNGSVNNSTPVTVNPIQTPVLNYIILSPSTTTTLTVGQTQKFNATAKDQNGNPMSGINISWMSSNLTVGNLTPLFSITGSDGNAQATFNALVSGNANIIVQNGSVNDSTSVTVNMPLPSTLNVAISESSDPVLSNGTSQVTVHVTADGLPVEGAAVDASVTGGSLVSSSGLTDASGDFKTTYNAPNVSSSTAYTISATASKTGFTGGSGSDPITVNPVPSTTFTITNIVTASGKTYTTDTLAVGKLFYIDRTYTFTSVPSAFNGLDYIKTATTDRYNTSANFLQFDVNTDVTVYVAYDDRIYPKASWLSSFTDTGNNLARSDGVAFSIYSKSFPAGHISIGGCSISSTGAGGMYIVIVKPAGTPAPSTLGVSISESPDPVLSNGTSQITVHVTSGGSNVIGANVDLSVTGGSLGSIAGTTDASGDFTATYNAPSVAAPAIYTISATASKTGFTAGSGSGQITVNPIPVLNYIAVSPSSTTLTVGQTRTFNAAAKDQNGNPMPGINISWTSSNLTVGNMAPLFSVTGPDGNASATFNALVSGNANIIVQNGSVNDSTSVTVNMPLPSTLNVAISESSDPVLSNGTSQVTVHVTADGLPVEGAAVEALVTGGSLVSSSGLTDASGDFKTTYNAPNVSASTAYTISATASKIGFTGGSGSDQITVNPVSSTFTITNIVTASGKTYTTDTLAVGKLFYIDRTYTFTSVPSAYNGLDYIKTATTDRYNTSANFLQFDVNTDVTVYVAYDDRIYPKASWLSSFTDTGNNLARSDGVAFSIYSKSFPAGHISIGGCSISSTGAGGMYIVIVKPAGTPAPPMLGVSISESPDPVLSDGTSQVTVHVTSAGLPVEGAAVDASVTGGSLVSSGGLTDANGDFKTTYNAPNVSASTAYVISATASKTGFTGGSGSDPITVNPVSSSTFMITNIVTASGKTYTQDTLALGKLFYIDRTYTFTSVPSAYNGLDYIKTATTDRYNTSANFLQFDVNTDVTVYVAYDDRITPKASWLSSFTDTGNNIARSDGVAFSIYSKSFPAGHISIGGCSISSTGAGGMYVVIVKPVGTP